MTNTITNDKEIFLNRKEAAEFLGCKATTLALWKTTKRYSIPCLRIGKNVKYRLYDLKKFMEDSIK